MDRIKTEVINRRRRYFFGAAAATAAAALLGIMDSVNAQPGPTRRAQEAPLNPGANKSFAPLRHIDAGVLNVGYAEAGPTTAPAVLLLHGWPHDIHSYVDVAPLLASAATG